ncbi:hypothetical protein RRG08_045244 [Elysia crispata]|uniref:acid phosphatase n=1 Tax=Elysia crispata TaxID=231223 RepID=A0AAE1A1C7_9GAST|nr:hypothetical protein RRG08_045244 [Elysia crispata]
MTPHRAKQCTLDNKKGQKNTAFRMRVLCTVFVFASLVLGSCLASPPDSLRLVAMVYRHGDRSPVEIYPKDINQQDKWPMGLGWLTNLGKQQQYELGQYVKERYHGFINTAHYDQNEIAIESSSITRCLMSAYSHLAGLFPPQGDQIWNKDIKWQPIPVTSRPTKEDNKLALQKKCPKYDELYQRLLDSPEFKAEEERNKDFYEMVEKNTGIKKETLSDIWGVVDTLICEKSHNLTWNDWVYEDGVWDKLDDLRTASFDLLFNDSAMARLQGGPLLKEIIGYMKAATGKERQGPKFYMYSAHDSTVAALLSALHAYDRHQPIYRALVMLELHEIDSEFVVKVLYRNDTTADPYLLIPKGCSESCTLSELIEVTKDTVPDDWEKECQATSSSSHELSPASWIALGIAVGLCIAFVAALIIWLVQFRNRRGASYARLNP